MEKEICSLNNGRCAMYDVPATYFEKMVLGVAYKLRVTRGLHCCDAKEERIFHVDRSCPEKGVNMAMDFYKGFPDCGKVVYREF